MAATLRINAAPHPLIGFFAVLFALPAHGDGPHDERNHDAEKSQAGQDVENGEHENFQS